MEATIEQIDNVTQAAHDDTGPSWSFLLERLLDDDASLDEVIIDDDARAVVLPRMLLVSISGLLAFGLAVGITVQIAWGAEFGTPMLWVPLSLVGGFLTALAVGLPSFYFYTQLAGLDASFRLVTAQAVRLQARTSVLLLGILPFYAAIALASVLDVGWIDDFLSAASLGLASPAATCVAIGFALPFVVGLAGKWSVYRSFRRLVKVLPITHPRRGNVVLRMLLMWGAVGAAVAPIAMYRIAQWLWTVT